MVFFGVLYWFIVWLLAVAAAGGVVVGGVGER